MPRVGLSLLKREKENGGVSLRDGVLGWNIWPSFGCGCIHQVPPWLRSWEPFHIRLISLSLNMFTDICFELKS